MGKITVLLRFMTAYFRDALSFSDALGRGGPGRAEYMLAARLHWLEKSLSVPAAVSPERERLVQGLLAAMREYAAAAPLRDSVFYASAFSCLEACLGSLSPEDVRRVRADISGLPVPEAALPGGVRRLKRAEILKGGLGCLPEVYASRHSVRDFSGDTVPMELIERAVELAGGTPSVCNRQPGRVRVISDAAAKAAVLAVQPGSTGFRDKIGRLLVVSSDLRAFFGPDERNQPYIGGGMFAMSLLYALHHLGAGACVLNWQGTREQELAIRGNSGIPEHEAVICLIAAGMPPESFLVPVSVRRRGAEILARD